MQGTKDDWKRRFSWVLREYADGNKSQMARDLGTDTQQVSKLTGGKTGNPSADTLLDTLRAYPEINPTWLLTGKGPKRWGDEKPDRYADGIAHALRRLFVRLEELAEEADMDWTPDDLRSEGGDRKNGDDPQPKAG